MFEGESTTFITVLHFVEFFSQLTMIFFFFFLETSALNYFSNKYFIVL